MKLRTKVVAIAVTSAAVAAVGAFVVVHTLRKRTKERVALARKPSSHPSPREAREQVRELLRLRGEDFIPDGLGTSLYQRRLNTMNDRQLLILLALTQVGVYIREQGVDPLHPSEEAKAEAKELFRGVVKGDDEARSELLAKLGAMGGDVVKELLRGAMALLTGEDLMQVLSPSTAAQAA